MRTIMLSVALAVVFPTMADGQGAGSSAHGVPKTEHFEANIVPRSYEALAIADADAGNDVVRMEMDTQDPAEASFFFGALVEADDEGSSGSVGNASTNCTATASFDVETGRLELFFLAATSSSAQNVSTDDPAPFVETRGQFRVNFDVVTASMVSFSGEMDVTTGSEPSYADCRVEIIPVPGLPEVPFRQTIMATGGSDAAVIEDAIMLEPGSYQLRIRTVTESYFDDDDDFGVTHALSNLRVTVVMTPAEPEVYFWEALDGAFSNEENWEPEGVPGSGDTAIFDRDQSYIVSMGMEESARAIVERGDVSFLGGSYTLGGGSPGEPSLAVGNDAADTAALSLVNGHALSSAFATLGRTAGASGVVSLSPLGSATSWEVAGRLVIGDLGMGRVTLDDNGRLNAGEVRLGNLPGSLGTLEAHSNGTGASASVVFTSMAVGVDGTGEVDVRDDAVFGNTVSVGLNADSAGFLTVGGEMGLFEAGLLTVGDGGSGTVTVEGGGVLSAFGTEETNVIGNEAGSSGDVLVEGCESRFQAVKLAVGERGRGVVDVADGGRLEAEVLSIGFDNGGEGEVSLSGQCSPEMPSALSMPSDSTAIVGGRGTGVLRIADGAVGDMGEVTLGALSGGVGLAVVDDADWFVAGQLGLGDALLLDGDPPASGTVILQNGGFVSCGGLVVLPGSGIFGSGTLEVPPGAGNVVQGTLAAGVWVQPPPMKQEGEEAPLAEREEGHGTLLIGGDIVMDGGVIDLSAGGAGESDIDALVVDGDLLLDGTALVVNFRNGYAPEAGEMRELIRVSGTVEAMDLALDYTGLEDGFEYAIHDDGGILIFEALTDGVAATMPVDENGDQPRAGCFGAGAVGGGSDSGLGWLLVALVMAGLAVDGARWRRARGED